MVYDCFPFFNELDILKLRLQIMDPFVDKFVLEEATVTFSGEPKPLYYAENKEMFKKWEDKIIHIVVDDCPEGIPTHDMDQYQKDHLLKGIAHCKEDDICIFSDVDEIPNTDIFAELFPKLEMGKIYHLAQRMFYCFLNAEEVSGKLLSNSGDFEGVEKPMWLGTKIFYYGSLQGRGFFDLRDKKAKENGVRVENGGWHFGYMGGNGEKDLAKRIGDKVVAAAHQEYNDEEILAQVVDRIMTGQDIFGRDAEFKRVEIDETFPKYLREHLAEYEYLIMPKVTKAEIMWRKCSMKAKRALRRVKRGIKRVFRKKGVLFFSLLMILLLGIGVNQLRGHGYFSMVKNYLYHITHKPDFSQYTPFTEEEIAWGKETGFIAHAMGSIDGDTYSNSLEAFEASYEKGFRVFEVDFSLTSDGKTVCTHDFENYEEVPTYEKYMLEGCMQKYTALDVEAITRMMVDYPDICIITDFKWDNSFGSDNSEVTQIMSDLVAYGREAAKEAGFTEESLLERFWVQIYNEETYRLIEEVYHFPHYVYTLYLYASPIYEQVMAFCLENDIQAVTIEQSRVTEDVISQLKEWNILTYVHTVNEEEKAKELFDSGVVKLYTDDLIW